MTKLEGEETPRLVGRETEAESLPHESSAAGDAPYSGAGFDESPNLDALALRREPEHLLLRGQTPLTVVIGPRNHAVGGESQRRRLAVESHRVGE